MTDRAVDRIRLLPDSVKKKIAGSVSRLTTPYRMCMKALSGRAAPPA